MLPSLESYRPSEKDLEKKMGDGENRIEYGKAKAWIFS